MKIMIVTDMEGCAGILNHDDWVMRAGQFYEKGVRILTQETNAAIAGFFEAGATEVLVRDGHGAGGIDPELLDERATLQRGPHSKGFLGELDGSFAGLAFVGQHARPARHTRTSRTRNGSVWIDLSINGVSIGEYGQCALRGDGTRRADDPGLRRGGPGQGGRRLDARRGDRRRQTRPIA